MSQNKQETALSRCPGCEEPLEPGDLFCGACGYDLSAVPEPPRDRPTIAIATGAGAPAGAVPERPRASGDFELAAPATAAAVDGTTPDPRTSPDPVPVPPAGTKVCGLPGRPCRRRRLLRELRPCPAP